MEAKKIKEEKSCASKCKFKCSENISMDILDFYKMDSNSKHEFINRTTICTAPARSNKNKETKDENANDGDTTSRRRKSYKCLTEKAQVEFAKISIYPP